MIKTIFMDKYPVYSLELDKNEIDKSSANEIIKYFKEKIDSHPVATYIAEFDHYAHTKNINGNINPEILDAKNIVFCFGKAIPNTKILAARPRSIGVAELADKFVVEFIEAPNEQLTEVMEEWSKSLKVR
jgi:uncharacterized protein YifN (PemK superfamily)